MVLVTREIAIPSEAYGGGWWSADHLFLDQDGIPTIVGIKPDRHMDWFKAELQKQPSVS